MEEIGDVLLCVLLERTSNEQGIRYARMSFDLLVRGSFACFRRPEFAIDLISYDTMTPFAARGIFESVHWTPSIRWHVERIFVLNEVRTRWGLASEFGLLESNLAPLSSQTRACVLTDVAYLLRASFQMTAVAGVGESPAQHAAIFRRRLRQGRLFRRPYLGMRQFVAETTLVDADHSVPAGHYDGAGERDLGWTVYDKDPENRRMIFFRAHMSRGVIDLDRAGLLRAS